MLTFLQHQNMNVEIYCVRNYPILAQHVYGIKYVTIGIGGKLIRFK